MAAVQAGVYGSSEALLTPAIWNGVLQRKLYEHTERKQFRLGHHGTGDSSHIDIGRVAAEAALAAARTARQHS